MSARHTSHSQCILITLRAQNGEHLLVYTHAHTYTHTYRQTDTNNPPSHPHTQNGEQLRVNTSKGGKIDADMVIMSIGVRAESTLAKEAGLKLTKSGCIEVDENMRTSHPKVRFHSFFPFSGRWGGRELFVKDSRVETWCLCLLGLVYRGSESNVVSFLRVCWIWHL